MYAITGITGKVGGAVARTLLRQNQGVRAIVRDAGKGQDWANAGCDIAIADFDDTASMAEAFAGTEGVFIVLPPVFDPSEGFPEARAMIANIKAALISAPPPKAVVISTIGADATQTNLLSQLAILEAELSGLDMPVIFLRPAWFMENAAWDVADAKGGLIRSYLHPLDKAFPMVATEDVGQAAAALLLETWSGVRIVELEGPVRVSPNDLAAAFSSVLGRTVQAEIVARDEWENLFRGQGMANPLPRMQMLDGFNAGWIDFPQARSRHGTTTLAEVVQALVANG